MENNFLAVFTPTFLLFAIHCFMEHNLEGRNEHIFERNFLIINMLMEKVGRELIGIMV